jgi:hypothetical protein
MPHRSKKQAELMLSIGAALIAMQDGKTPEEAVEVIRHQLEVRASLDSKHTTAPASTGEPMRAVASLESQAATIPTVSKS